MWVEKRSKNNYKFVEQYKNPLTGKPKRVSVTLSKNTAHTRKEAQAAFDDSLSKLRLKYPKIQSMSKSDNCLCLYAYTDDGHENVLSLGLYKGNGGAYFVRLNVYSDYLVRRNREE